MSSDAAISQDVQLLEQFLIDQGFLQRSEPNGAVDDEFRTAQTRALNALAAALGLKDANGEALRVTGYSAELGEQISDRLAGGFSNLDLSAKIRAVRAVMRDGQISDGERSTLTTLGVEAEKIDPVLFKRFLQFVDNAPELIRAQNAIQGYASPAPESAIPIAPPSQNVPTPAAPDPSVAEPQELPETATPEGNADEESVNTDYGLQITVAQEALKMLSDVIGEQTQGLVSISLPSSSENWDQQTAQSLQEALVSLRLTLGLPSQGPHDPLWRYSPEVGSQLLQRIQSDPRFAEQAREIEGVISSLDELHKADILPSAVLSGTAAQELEVATYVAERGLGEIADFIRSQGQNVSEMGELGGTFDADSQKVLQECLVNIRRYLGMQGENLHQYTPEIGSEILRRFQERAANDPSLAEQAEDVPTLINALDVLHRNRKIDAGLKEGVDNNWLPGVHPMMIKGIEMGLNFLKSNMPGLFELISTKLLGIVNTVLNLMGFPMTVQQMFPKIFPPETTPPAQAVASLSGEYRNAMEFGLNAGFKPADITSGVMGVMNNMMKLPSDMPAGARTQLQETLRSAFTESQKILEAQGAAGLDQAAQLFEQNLHSGIAAINQAHGLSLELPGLAAEDSTELRADVVEAFRENLDDAGLAPGTLDPLEQQYRAAPAAPVLAAVP
jgi:hypothetical protein